MIFSLSSEIVSSIPSLPSEELDVFTYFQTEKSIELFSHQDLFLRAMMSSLRMKKGILVLDKTISSNEIFRFNRGLRAYEGEGFIYLAPHSLSLLRPFLAQDASTFQSFRTLIFESNLLKS